MGHIIRKEINTNGEYKKLAEELGINFEAGVQYTMQGIGQFYYQLNSEQPTEEGFYHKDCKEFGFTPVDGEDLWVKTKHAIFVVAK